MKRTFAFIAIFLNIAAFSAHSQRFAYVDTEYILEQIPEYRSAQKQLDAQSEKWQKEIEDRLSEIDRLYRDFQAEQVLLTDELKRKRQEEIINKEKAVKSFQKEKFGFEGELFRKRQELIKPIQDRVFDAIQIIAKESALDFILDKASGPTMLYSNAKYDRSDDVLAELGVTNVEDFEEGEEIQD